MADKGTSRIISINAPLPGFSGQDIAVPSDDGSELYQFDKQGRHLRTVNTMTGATLYSFDYDASGRLTEVTDGDGNVTQIERNASGQPTAIVAPFGQRTALSLNANGFLKDITNPENEEAQFTYSGPAGCSEQSDGLLGTKTDARNNVSEYCYNALGRLVRAENRADGSKTLSRSDVSARTYETSMTTGLGEQRTYRVTRGQNGDLARLFTDPAGLESDLIVRQDGTTTSLSADGTVTESEARPDPRFGVNAATLAKQTTTTPDGRTKQLEGSREVTLGNPSNPLSLQAQTDRMKVNGRTYTTTYDASQRRFTSTTPEARTSVVETDDQGRPTRQTTTDLHPVTTAYKSDGRVETVKQGPDNDPSQARTWSYAYEPGSGLLDKLTDPLGRETAFNYDAAGRVTTQTLPGNRVVSYGYDDNGNLTSVTPPSRPAHAFGFTATDLLQGYTPPDLGFSPRATTYEYDDDKKLKKVTRPDGTPGGRSVTFQYESATQRLDYFDEPGGLRTDLSYSPSTGNVS